MTIKIVPNPSGTSVEKGQLYIRCDLFIDEPESKSYKLQQAQYVEWQKRVAFDWKLNPALAHFITVPEGIKLEDIEGYIKSVFNSNLIATLDETLVLPEATHYLSPLMRNLGKFGSQVQTADKVDLINSVNKMLDGLTIPLLDGGKPFYTEKQSIDIGDQPTVGAEADAGLTIIEVGNPANATGTLDTWKVGSYSAITGLIVGTFYTTTGTNRKCRDNESIGNQDSYATITYTGKSTSVTSGDFAGHYAASGKGAGLGSGSGIGYVSGQYIDVDDVTSYDFTSYTSYACYVYATGTESGAPSGSSSSVVAQHLARMRR